MEKQEMIAVIILNRICKANAMTPDMFLDFSNALSDCDVDNHIKVIIVTGYGRSFCSGMDLTYCPDLLTQMFSEKDEDNGGRLSLKIFNMSKPIIAAINGPAIGMGASILLPMDLRIGTNNTFFRFPFAKMGITPESCSSWFLPRIVGINKALEWMISGRDIHSLEALNVGLLQYIEEDENKLLDTAKKIALTLIEGNSPVSVSFTRKILWESFCLDSPYSAHKLESQYLKTMSKHSHYEKNFLSQLRKRE